MITEKTVMLGVPLMIIYDESGRDYDEHESGAFLSFNKREVQSYCIEWEGKRELILMLKNLDEANIMKGTWECMFKALSVNSDCENFSDLSKEIYFQTFMDNYRKITGLTETMWEKDNREFMTENDFIDHDCYDFDYDLVKL